MGRLVGWRWTYIMGNPWVVVSVMVKYVSLHLVIYRQWSKRNYREKLNQNKECDSRTFIDVIYISFWLCPVYLYFKYC